MNNLEKAVIEAAKALARGNPHPATGLALELKDAVEALETDTPRQRKFWINYHLSSLQGRGEGGIDAYVTGPVTTVTLNAWKAGISAANGGASVVIRTWTELEA